ncbi:inhibitor of growth protein 3-like isoform X1 [Mytilus californianus]|uniref:inhibitor of growth protein 3-like isoform X1 n=1 Tax=Mytilus californianus TaxID=6549 RepID=UPI0022475E9B|nr:inhibitor of growth protein 3-like isoform X1 [Mytilus californianus]
MLYLEDYLEMIENLPMEMRERLTEMREMDLQVQNALDELDERVKSFFKKCTQPNAKQEWKDEQFEKIKKDYYKSLEDADEKVHLATHIYDLVDRHLRKLDQELSKFKMELEADNAGITEVLEKRSLELDKPPSINNHRTEKRRILHSQPVMNNHSSEKRIATEKVLSSLAHEAALEAIGQRKPQSNSNSPALSMFNSTSVPSLTYSLGHVGAGSNAAIAAAASQAIAATQQSLSSQDFISSGITIETKTNTRRADQSNRIKLQHGRRTPSMKASLMAMSELSKELTIPKDVYSSAPSTPTASHEPKISRSKKQTTKAAQLSQSQQQSSSPAIVSAAQSLLSQKQPLTPQTPATPAEASPLIREDANSDLQIVDEHGQPIDWQNDPNEPRYCLCNQVSYGDMVGCDNDDCPIEWFHYGCVGLTQAPKGKWYCPQCTAAMKRRGRK